MRKAQRASNGLNILVKVIRYMANRNDGHPSYNHGLKCNNSLIDPHWSALRINFRLNHQPCSSLQSQLFIDIWSNPGGSKHHLKSHVIYKSP